ncbi:MAG: bifunctional DNA-binding transcriptional regulator/O6-methylguanine-DNA methyltransferase Ada [Alphaproteobacteria bacterium]|nr:bifunctional DNA-binding transcriptional regulator/O6-methylguanine-DNA methyltransferase Ada [Alphaproteobacteria bacterium]
MTMDAQTERHTRTAWDSDAARWRAVAARDRSADGAFVYAVETTGVYCRPGCASRRPRPENVRYFAGAAEAEAAGFRACRRCRPDGAEPAAAAVTAACRTLEAAEEMPALAALAESAGLSLSRFQRLFRERAGVTPRAYFAACRDGRARTALASGAGVTAALHEAGFGSSGRFYEAAPAMLGMTPGAFRAGGAGETVRFALGHCSLGEVLVAGTDRGLCAIELGDDPAALLAGFQHRFRRARLEGGDAAFEDRVARVVGFLDDPAAGLGLPLDIRGTAFQRRVWQALTEIPAGQAVTYAELAQRLGVPRAVRAVAGACAANRLAVAIPCHRVVRTGGGLAGYRWGIARKRALLDREAAP